MGAKLGHLKGEGAASSAPTFPDCPGLHSSFVVVGNRIREIQCIHSMSAVGALLAAPPVTDGNFDTFRVPEWFGTLRTYFGRAVERQKVGPLGPAVICDFHGNGRERRRLADSG